MTLRPSRKTFRPRLEDMVSSLRKGILTGALAPESYLPSEKQLADQFGLSVQSVRKGLDLLVADALIEKIPKIGSKVLDPADKGTVTIRLGYAPSLPDDADIHHLLELFHQAYPNILVEAIPLASFTYEHYRPYLENGMLDVITLNYENYSQFADSGGLDNLEPLERQNELYPFLSDAFTDQGKLWIQPFAFSPLVLCYNRSHFAQLGLQEPDSSWSWQRLTDTAAALSIPDERAGFHCYFSTLNRAGLLLMQKGGVFERDGEGRLKLAGTRMLEAIRYSGELYKNAPPLPNSLMYWENQKVDMFLQGKLSLMITSYFILNHFRQTEVDYDIAPVPHFGQPLTTLIIIGLAVNARSRNKEAARKLVEFLTSSPAQLAIRQNTCSLPARISAAEWRGADPEGVNRPSRFSLFREIMPSYRLYTDLNLSHSEFRKVFDELRLYWADLQSEEKLCAEIEGVTVR